MKKIYSTLIEVTVVFLLYTVLLHLLAGGHIIAGILSPGSHLPFYYPIVILLFLLCRLYLILLPGILLGRFGLKRLRSGRKDQFSPES